MGLVTIIIYLLSYYQKSAYKPSKTCMLKINIFQKLSKKPHVLLGKFVEEELAHLKMISTSHQTHYLFIYWP